jgi:hypothetical protein
VRLNYDHRGPNRLPPRWFQILNPVWLASDAERNHNWTWRKWFLRNPFCNLFMVVIGIAHKPRTCAWTVSPWTYADRGWNLGYVQADNSWIKMPFISYRGRRFECSIGWKTSGGFTAAARRANSPNAEDTTI